MSIAHTAPGKCHRFEMFAEYIYRTVGLELDIFCYETFIIVKTNFHRLTSMHFRSAAINYKSIFTRISRGMVHPTLASNLAYIWNSIPTKESLQLAMGSRLTPLNCYDCAFMIVVT